MKALKENRVIKLLLKGSLIIMVILSISVCAKAQDKVIFPFQGGIDVMNHFFKDSVNVSQDIIQARATGTVIFKFTADQNGIIKNIIIYYADDVLLASPLIDVLKKSSHHWIIPDNEKLHDFIISFNVGFNPPAKPLGVVSASYKFYKQRKPIATSDQIPLNSATLLPTIAVNYDVQ